jgi:hypothetical protein
MSRDLKLPLTIAACLVLLALVYLMVSERQEAGRPQLREIRIVSATAADPVFRDGSRHVGPEEEVVLAVVMRIEERRRSYWLAPVDEVVLDGQVIEHQVADTWPEKDRYARVFWFTLEHPYLNGKLGSESGEEALAYKPFLVPEMGRDLHVLAVTDSRNDSFLGRPEEVEEIPGGTLRFYARVEIASTSHRVKPLQTATSLDEQQLLHPAMPVIHRSAELPAPLHAVVGELVNLPEFSAEGDSDQAPPDEVGQRLLSLVEQRIVATSDAFAALAVSGQIQLPAGRVRSLGTVSLAEGTLSRDQKLLQWHEDVQTGDLLRTGNHWLVLSGDDGNGLLDENDEILHCWREPAVAAILSKALTDEETTFELLRYEPVSAP